jgi:alpha-mannosidase
MVNRRLKQTRLRIAQTASRLHSRAYAATIPLDTLLVSERTTRIGFDAAQQLEFRPARIGETFGPQWATYWFRVAATVPETWAGRRVDLLFDTGSEATLWRGGEPVRGLNAPHRTTAPLTHAAEPGETIELQVEMACNDWMGEPDPGGSARDRLGRTWRDPTDDRAPRAPKAPAQLARAGLALFDADAWELAWDFDVLRALSEEPGLDPAWAGHLLAELDRFAATNDMTILAHLLAHRNAQGAHDATAIGHAHLDTAWLWPLAESRRKVIRSFANQLELMDRYPEHRFLASSAQHYAWLEQDAPSLYARVAERVREGRWEATGGTWVEPDLNLPSGESLVRQLLYGQRDFERRFGDRCRIFWAPDTFGYNGQVPQLLRQAGIDRFLTQKLSWNQFTEPPHHTFRWEGIDGSGVLVHMPPADTYNAEVEVAELRAAAARFKDHDRGARSLLVFGFGDGGGGPTAEMLERARRVRDLQGVPRLEIATAAEFFDRLDHDQPTIVGELYFEYHRGTYTSQTRTKRGNRRCERLLHEAEAICALAGGAYPREQLRELWHTVLLNQFHDILPGSSIGAVYEDAERDHARVAAEATRLRDEALARLDGEPAPLNLTPFARTDVVDGTLYASPPYGFGVPAAGAVRADGLTLENEHLRATFDERGRLVSLLHAGREALAGPANVFELSDDRPTAYDAWELEPYVDDTRRALPGAHSHEVRAHPLRAEIVFEHDLLRQTVRLDAGASRIEFRTEIDWQERHRLLRVAFPLAVRATTATAEMQFGVAERPTHTNTQADLARFEVPAHRFADLSEHGFGVALLTPDTYGVAARGGELRLSLLRGPTDPDPDADRGRHEIAYAVMPHAGSWQDAGVVGEGRTFAEPLIPARGSGAFAAVEGGLVLDTVKRAEDSDALVLRLYEPHGGRGTARVRLATAIAHARRANLLEEPGEELRVEAGELEVDYLPFEVLTVVTRSR